MHLGRVKPLHIRWGLDNDVFGRAVHAELTPTDDTRREGGPAPAVSSFISQSVSLSAGSTVTNHVSCIQQVSMSPALTPDPERNLELI